ncbi:MAG: hypothetical protein EP298_01555 [Gammaproteobacteria bacterium]|nr:MAG: hypothetical protein EP298_01555 [Gammaproteobacteria bacterium]
MPVSKITHRSKEGDRDIIVINGYAFYRSTGNNSNMPGTWFPFKGIAPELFGGWFIKPSDPNLLLSKALMTQEYFSQRDSKGTIARFGNIETAYLSYCLGGSCWQKAKKSFDLEHDPLKIKNWFHYTFIKYFASQNIDLGQTIEVNEEADFITEDNQLVNKWLVEQGAKHIL